MKTCNRCAENKPLTEFGRSKRDGVWPQCKSCRNVLAAEYRAAHPWKVVECNARYYAANVEKMLARNAKWAAANRDKVREKDAKWRAANPGIWRVYWNNRRAKLSGGQLSPDIAERLHKLQRGKCACGCKQPLGNDFHRDHIMPVALGGSNTDDNIQLLRKTCNLQKHAKHPIDFMQSKGFLL